MFGIVLLLCSSLQEIHQLLWCLYPIKVMKLNQQRLCDNFLPYRFIMLILSRIAAILIAC